MMAPSGRSYRGTYAALALFLAGAVVGSACIGAFTFTPARIASFIAHQAGWTTGDVDPLGRNVFFQLRLPRVLISGLTGAVLGVSGTLMQGLFRNPIVEPGLAGTSAGAGPGASLIFVLGGGPGGVALRAPLGAVAGPVAAV